MKRILNRIIGFIEFVLGFTAPAYAISQLIFNDKYVFQWVYVAAIPIYIGFIKYGWRAMFNTIDITDEKGLKPEDIFYKNAVIKAQSNIELFISYLNKGIFECNVLIPIEENEKVKRLWVQARYLDNFSIIIFPYPESYPEFNDELKGKVAAISEIEDWSVKKNDDTVVGLYTIKALAEKAVKNGYTLNWKSNQLVHKIIN